VFGVGQGLPGCGQLTEGPRGGLEIAQGNDCTCVCGQLSCPPQSAIQLYQPGQCAGVSDVLTSEDDCTSTPGGQTFSSVTAVPFAEPPSCEPMNNSPPPNAAGWASEAAVCVLGEAASCLPDSLELPEGYDARPCVFQVGNRPCPGGRFTERVVIKTAFEDERTCSCSCTPQDLECVAITTLYGDTGCATEVATISVEDGCLPNVASFSGVTSKVDLVGQCVASGEVAGSATATGDTTVCCDPQAN
jgi:hypothetical protein